MTHCGKPRFLAIRQIGGLPQKNSNSRFNQDTTKWRKQTLNLPGGLAKSTRCLFSFQKRGNIVPEDFPPGSNEIWHNLQGTPGANRTGLVWKNSSWNPWFWSAPVGKQWSTEARKWYHVTEGWPRNSEAGTWRESPTNSATFRGWIMTVKFSKERTFHESERLFQVLNIHSSKIRKSLRSEAF